MEQTTIDKLQAALAANEAENAAIKSKIAEALHAAVLPELTAQYVGKHFKKIDHYADGHGFNTVYNRVLALPKQGVATVVQFDDDPDGTFIYSDNETEHLEHLGEEITADEYNAAAQRALARLKF